MTGSSRVDGAGTALALYARRETIRRKPWSPAIGRSTFQRLRSRRSGRPSRIVRRMARFGANASMPPLRSCPSRPSLAQTLSPIDRPGRASTTCRWRSGPTSWTSAGEADRVWLTGGRPLVIPRMGADLILRVHDRSPPVAVGSVTPKQAPGDLAPRDAVPVTRWRSDIPAGRHHTPLLPGACPQCRRVPAPPARPLCGRQGCPARSGSRAD